jgi:branched-subunit amino acid aminotransferase/4-amino-4-deoxychorismate lyase
MQRVLNWANFPISAARHGMNKLDQWFSGEFRTRELPVKLSGGEFLKTRPRGGYTAFKVSKVVNFESLEFHSRRLVQSFQILLQNELLPNTLCAEDLTRIESDEFREILISWVRQRKEELPCVAVALLHISEEKTLCLEILWKTTDEESELKTEDVGIIAEVQAESAWRNFPNAKDSHWVLERAPYEAKKGSGVDEVFLHNGSFLVSEGLVSNVFAVKRTANDEITLITAPDDIVLCGWIRHLILEKVMSIDKVTVLLQPIDLSKVEEFDEIFITSKSLIVSIVRIVNVHVCSDSFRVVRAVKELRSRNDDGATTIWKCRVHDDSFWKRVSSLIKLNEDQSVSNQ